MSNKELDALEWAYSVHKNKRDREVCYHLCMEQTPGMSNQELLDLEESIRDDLDYNNKFQGKYKLWRKKLALRKEA
jgi:hypothetical protein